MSSPNVLARRVQGLADSATIRLADLATARHEKGLPVWDFSAGRPPDSTPLSICEEAMRAMRAGDTHQTPARGQRRYLEAVSGKLLRENGLSVDPEREIVATLGCKQGLMLALSVLLDPGDEVVIEDPAFVSYGPAIEMLGGRPVAAPLRAENGFRWRREDLERVVGDRTRVLLFCSPQNPAGSVYSRDDLRQIADFAIERDLAVIVDEIYERMTWQGREHVCLRSLDGMAERTVGLMGTTKAFAMGGWRVGFAYGPEAAVAQMVKLQAHYQTSAGSLSQRAAAFAYRGQADEELHAMWASWFESCQTLCRAVDRIPGVRCRVPEGGFYGWIDVRGLGLKSEPTVTRLIDEYGMVLVPGVAFGPASEGFLRLTAAKSTEQIERVVEALTEALTEALPRFAEGD